MTTGSRPRFSVRAGLADAPEHDGPFENVPDHLCVPLQRWVRDVLSYQGSAKNDEAQPICLRLRIAPTLDRFGGEQYLRPLEQAVGPQLLDVVDEILRSDFATMREVGVLEVMLDDAGSAYRVTEVQDGLEERVTPAVRDAVRQTIADASAIPSAGSAADHLATAWQTAYGRNPDPVRAYSEGIKAVECAAHATISPKNDKPTLGTMLRDLSAAPQKFTAAITAPAAGDPLAVVETMMRSLWQGQTSRHGAQTETIPETLQAARAAVHLAATLVQWFTSGAVSRRP